MTTNHVPARRRIVASVQALPGVGFAIVAVLALAGHESTAALYLLGAATFCLITAVAWWQGRDWAPIGALVAVGVCVVLGWFVVLTVMALMAYRI